jgi:hypothetical protein
MDHKNGRLLFDEIERRWTGLGPELSDHAAPQALHAVEFSIDTLRQLTAETESDPRHAARGEHNEMRGALSHLGKTMLKLRSIIDPKITNEQIDSLEPEQIQETISQQFLDFLRGK